VNVSSGTGLPGLSRTNGREMVVVVIELLSSCMAIKMVDHKGLVGCGCIEKEVDRAHEHCILLQLHIIF